MSTNPECPSDDQVARFLDAQLPADERAIIRQHLTGCASCRALVGGAAASPGDSALAPGPASASRPPPVRGTVVGRYVILDVVGAGGTATVCAAYDPELDRRVAVKLLHLDARHEPLLAREAQTLAKLNDPNVATVFDVGDHDGQRFLAMELATGTLRAWLATPRAVDEVVAMLAAAGDGLVAAHRAGVVHGDFKPENVLVGDDERPRVSDFGLARRVGEGEGRISGTPVYMAPEQIGGAAADAQADAFAFGVTLYEALYGQHPFDGTTMAELAAAARAGAVRTPPTDRAAPAWLHRVVVDALSADPKARPPLPEVLARLRAPRLRRRWIAVAAAAAIAAVVATIVIAPLVSPPAAAPAAAPPPSCEDEAAASLAGVWDAPRRAAVSDKFTSSKAPAATALLASTLGLLDRYASAWSAMAVESCRATRVDHVQPQETMALRASCLADRRRELRAWTDVLARADAGVVGHAISGTGQLAGVSECGDVAALAGPLPKPRDPGVAARLDAALADIDDAEAAVRAGALDDPGHARAVAALTAIRAIGHAPSAAYAATVVGDTERGRGKIEDAIARAIEAAADAQRGRDDVQLLHALCNLAAMNGLFAGRPEEGLRFGALAAATAERLGNRPDDVSTVEAARAQVYLASGRLDEALAARRAVVASETALLGSDAPMVLESRSNVGMILSAEGRNDEAVAEFSDITPRIVRLFGSDNPETIPARENLGQALLLVGRVDEAAPLIESAPQSIAAAYGSDSPYMGASLVNLGELQLARGTLDDALATEQHAVTLIEPTSKDNPGLVEPLTQIGLIYTAMKRPTDALAPLERALKIAGTSAAPTDVAPTQIALARALVASGGDRTRADKLAAAARAAWRAAAAKWGGQNAKLADAATLAP